MTSAYTYTLTHYDETNAWASTVLAQSGENSAGNLDSIPLFTDQGTGEVNRLLFILNCGQKGKYLTQAPIIDQFDKIRLVATDGQGFSYNRVFEVKTIIPSEDQGQGTTAQIDCLGNEWYLQHKHYARPQWFKTAFEVMQDIGDSYNLDPATKANGGKMPDLVYHNVPYNHGTSADGNSTPAKLGNGLPSHTRNVYDYGTSEDMIYDVMMDLVDRQAATVDYGGIFDYFEMGFDTDASDLHKIYMKCPSSGSDPEANLDSLIEIDATSGGTSVNTALDEQEGGIEAQRATKVYSWGDLGTIPVDSADYMAIEYDWIFYPEWTQDVIYYVDSVVISEGRHFKCITTTDPPSAATKPIPTVDTLYWVRWNFSDHLGSKQYSPWTVDKATLWEQAGANLDAGTGSRMMWDGNLVINYTEGQATPKGNKDLYRTWVHVASGVDALGEGFTGLSLGGYNGSGTNLFYPDGFRFLNLENGGAEFITGTDPKTGKSFVNAVCRWNNEGGVAGQGFFEVMDKWDSDDMGNKVQVASLHDGAVFVWNSATKKWTAHRNEAGITDCFHTYDTLLNVTDFQTGTPILEGTKNFDFPSSDNYRSAIQIKTTWGLIETLTNTAGYFKGWAGFCFQFPFPHKRDSSYGEDIGDLYGNSDTLLPSFFDPQNMNWTSKGERGFNQTSSTDYGQVLDLSFQVRVLEQLTDTEDTQFKQRLNANFPCRVTCYDSNDNVVVADQNIPFRDNITDMHFKLNQFQVYRGAKPLVAIESLAGGTVIRPKEQELSNVFEWRNLQLISIQIQSFYDEYGRYSPLRGAADLSGVLDPQSQIPLYGATITFELDAFRWTKRNLATATETAVGGVQTERNIEAPFLQRNQIFSKRQLEKDALGEAQRLAFRNKEFTVGTQGKFDIRAFDSFLYTNPRIVYLDASQYPLKTGEAVNTIKLVAKKIEYSITKIKNGKGGFMRKILGSRRFE